MRLLLDTHIFLWYVQGSARMPAKSLGLIGSAESIFVSSACIWELAIKARRGHFHADLPKLIEAKGSKWIGGSLATAAACANRTGSSENLDRQLSGYSPLIQVV